MFHSELFTSSIASGANTFAQINYFTTDNILPPLVNGMQVSPDLPFLMTVVGVGAHMVHLRPQMNSFLPFPFLALSPNNRGGAAESPPRFWDFSSAPIPLKPTEEFDIFATQNAGAGEIQYVLATFCDRPPGPPPVAINPGGLPSNPLLPGRFFTAHWTATKTLTAGGWTQVQPAFDQTLPAGTYALLGARAFSATGIFFRMFPAMGPKWRPGGVCVQAYDSLDPEAQRYFSSYHWPTNFWGPWLTFYQNVPPQVEFFATAADTAEEGWFDLEYVGPSVAPSI